MSRVVSAWWFRASVCSMFVHGLFHVCMPTCVHMSCARLGILGHGLRARESPVARSCCEMTRKHFSFSGQLVCSDANSVCNRAPPAPRRVSRPSIRRCFGLFALSVTVSTLVATHATCTRFYYRATPAGAFDPLHQRAALAPAATTPYLRRYWRADDAGTASFHSLVITAPALSRSSDAAQL